jgi:16S rRNA (cytidine1402-2'-O)-methyltransferase
MAFCLGYLPHKTNERREFIGHAANLPYTLIFLESPHRIIEALEDLHAVLGDRRVCVAREMTKLFEEYWRGNLGVAVEYFKSQPVRGEFTLVIEGSQNDDNAKWTEEELRAAIKKELWNGKSAKEVSSELAEVSGWHKKEIYRLISLEK